MKTYKLISLWGTGLIAGLLIGIFLKPVTINITTQDNKEVLRGVMKNQALIVGNGLAIIDKP